MPRILRLLTIVALGAGLAGCGPKKLDTGHCPVSVAVAPQPVLVERRIYVPIPARLTQTEAMPEGPIAQCFDVAAQRRAVIERQNARAEQIRSIQGTEVKP